MLYSACYKIRSKARIVAAGHEVGNAALSRWVDEHPPVGREHAENIEGPAAPQCRIGSIAGRDAPINERAFLPRWQLRQGSLRA
jgi:hypothetical protein